VAKTAKALNKENMVGYCLSMNERVQMPSKNPRTSDYHEWLIESLKDPKAAFAYLQAALEESKKGDCESMLLLLLVLEDVIQARARVMKCDSMD
jgi:hypothetical protein